ncbi:MAG: M14 family metallopeptidase [Ignavibacteria bacterium]|nr:M14 family metallopeptidase [Ignavibacteria bacterium]
MKVFILLVLICFTTVSQELTTPFEKNRFTTTTYDQCIRFYKELDEKFQTVKITEAGETDIGQALHLVIISENEIFEPEELSKDGKVFILINNGIHPGEPDGIDASMILARELAVKGVPENVVVLIIPAYNIDGMLNRNNFTRVNQNGPLEYGFRGNAQNRDLNRDFIKCDTKNARSFVRIFRKWKPHLFVDTHTTDGADYPYKMTYIATHKDKLNPLLSDYLTNRLIPEFEKKMKQKGFETCPYVYNYRSTPDSGIVGFMESPRYSSGYAALFNTTGFISESHMLKSHEERVEAQVAFLKSLIEIAESDYKIIHQNKIKADELTKLQQEYVTSYRLDTLNPEKYLFKGYEAKYKKSNITGFERLYYDRNSPYEKLIDFFNNYIPVSKIKKPFAYIVPQGWWQVIELLKLNGIEMDRLDEDVEMEVESYYIESFDTRNPPFEGHYLHSNVKLKTVVQKRKFYKGDYLIYTGQESDNFICHVLEPESPDSYFNWNFFDAVLQQKEYFEPYLFEDIADSLMNSKPGLRKEFEKMKENDEKFRNDAYLQLKFIYDNTVREHEYMRYPVARVTERK